MGFLDRLFGTEPKGPVWPEQLPPGPVNLRPNLEGLEPKGFFPRLGRNMQWLLSQAGLAEPPRYPPVIAGPLPGTAVWPQPQRTELPPARGIHGIRPDPRFSGDLSRALEIMERATRSGSMKPVWGPSPLDPKPAPVDWSKVAVNRVGEPSVPSPSPGTASSPVSQLATPAPAPTGMKPKYDWVAAEQRLASGQMPPWMESFRQQLANSEGWDPGDPEISTNLMRQLLRSNSIPEEQSGFFAVMVNRAPLLAREYVLVNGVDGEPFLAAAYLPDYFQHYIDISMLPAGHPFAVEERQKIVNKARQQWAQAVARRDDKKSIVGYVRGEIEQASKNRNFTGTEADVIWTVLVAPYLHALGANAAVMDSRRAHLDKLYERWRDERTTGRPGEFLDWLLDQGFDPEKPFLGVPLRG